RPARLPGFGWVVVLWGIAGWGNELTAAAAEREGTLHDLSVSHPLVSPDPRPLYYRDTGLGRLVARSAVPPADPTGSWVVAERARREKMIAAGQVLDKLPAELPAWLKGYKANLRAVRAARPAPGAPPPPP